ncbi:MAG: Chemoreceptor glutamine deamidase CheD [Candidatus Celerinatantimonas neptuna]|nr:MAG: Chemoreceptor glutamine deamidase CheD [Candidatus Celerinatantimonas neptuna]
MSATAVAAYRSRIIEICEMIIRSYRSMDGVAEQSGNRVVHLHAGEMLFGRGSREIRTLLGSCISIVLWHPKLRHCGICHFALPEHPNGVTGKLDARYGDHCIELFRHFANGRHTELSEYQAKIFGGGNLLSQFKPPFDWSESDAQLERISVGEKNAAAAFSLLMSNHVRILVADVGEQCYRRLVLDTRSGDVWVQHHYVGGKVS